MSDNASIWWLIGLLVLGAAVGILSYDGPHQPDAVIQPVVDAGEDVSVLECTGIRMQASGYDPRGGEVTYEWVTEDCRGAFDDPSQLRPVFTTPRACGDPDTVELTLTVTNTHGVSASDSVMVYVCGPTCRVTPYSSWNAYPTVTGVTTVPPPGAPQCPLPLPEQPCAPTPDPCAPRESEACVPAPPQCAVPPEDCRPPVAPCPPEPCPPPPCPPPNCPPTADAGEDIIAPECTPVRLTCGAYDADGDALSYYWTAQGGVGHFDNPCLLHPVYTTPAVDCGTSEKILLTLTVTDSCGATACDTMIVCVTNTNHPPTADAGEDITAPECTPVQLTCGAYDADGDALSYRWTAQRGVGHFDNPCLLHPVYTTPAVDCGTTEKILLTLTVTDSCGATACDTMIVCVTNTNHPPTADAGEDISAPECARVRLTCDALDPDGDCLTYHWTVHGGRGHFEDPSLLHPIFVTPSIECSPSEAITVTLTVTDSCGSTASDSMTIYITDTNHAPRVELGPDVAVVSGSSFRLMPTVSDPDGEALHYQWIVPAGQGRIDGSSATNPAFNAPIIPYGAELEAVVTLIVTDARGASSSDSLRVRVRNPVPLARGD